MNKLSYAAIAAVVCLSLLGCSTPDPAPAEIPPYRSTPGQFKYNELIIKDYDEMSAMVNGLMRKARNVGQDGSNDLEALEHLREAAKLILSRPDSDNMVAKLMPEIRKELQGYNSFEDSMSSLAAEAMSVARNDNAANTPRATAFVVLQNLLSQLRPEVGSNAELRRVVERIRDARLSVPSDVKKDLKLRGMVVLKNTSDLAKEILKTPFKPAEKKAPAAPADEE